MLTCYTSLLYALLSDPPVSGARQNSAAASGRPHDRTDQYKAKEGCGPAQGRAAMNIKTCLFGYHKEETRAYVESLCRENDKLRREQKELRGQLERANMKITDLQTLLNIQEQFRRNRKG